MPTEELSVMPGEDPNVISGDHQIHGVFVGYGKAFANVGETQGLRLLDITPTILHLRGVQIPSCMDGRVLSQAMNERWLTEKPVVMKEVKAIPFREDDEGGDGSSSDGGSGQAKFSKEEEKVLEERLRGLGYIE